MIAANIAVARQFRADGAPFIYRVHEQPDREKLARFQRTARLLGVRADVHGAATPQVLAGILEELRGTDFEPVLSQLLLQALAKARYDAQPLGHFGLALEDYCHFTSPIRRYPDLFIHRVIKRYLHEGKGRAVWKRQAQDVADHCSETERAAMYAEFDSVDQKVAEYMAGHVGERYEGIISSIIDAGMFVRLDNSAEGMVPFRTMNDYYHYDADTLRAKGERGGRVYQVGQRVLIEVASADTERRQVNFILPDDLATPSAGSQDGAPGGGAGTEKRGGGQGSGAPRAIQSGRGAAAKGKRQPRKKDGRSRRGR